MPRDPGGLELIAVDKLETWLWETKRESPNYFAIRLNAETALREVAPQLAQRVIDLTSAECELREALKGLLFASVEAGKDQTQECCRVCRERGWFSNGDDLDKHKEGCYVAAGFKALGEAQ